MIPKVVERKIIELKKPSGSIQYVMTLPKEYADGLKRDGVNSLLIVFNFGLSAFPIVGKRTEKAIIAFLSKHPDLQELYTRTLKEEEG